MAERIAGLLNIRRGEGRPLLFLLAYGFVLGSALLFLDTVSYTLFLLTFDAASLPYVYLLVAVAGPLTGILYARMEARLPMQRLLLVALFTMFLSLFAIWAGVVWTGWRWLAFFLPIWNEVIHLLVGIGFWVLAGTLFNIRQGKRLFGVVGSGKLLAATLAGFSTPVLVAVAGSESLLLFAGVGLGLGLLVLLAILRAFPAQMATAQASADSQPPPRTRTMLRTRFIVLILALTCANFIAYYLADFIFYTGANALYPDSDQLAAFLGVLWGTVGALQLVLKPLFAGRFFDRFGLKVAIILLPLALSIGFGMTLAFGLLAGIGGGFFVLIVCIKVMDTVLAEVIDGDATLLLYQALPGRLRAPAQTFVGTIGAPVATGLAGGLLILLGLSSHITPIHLIGVTFLVVMAWLALALWVSREYITALLRSLKDRAFTGAVFEFTDRSSLAVLQEKLGSLYPDEVIYVMNVLERSESGLVPGILLDLASHPSVDVRREALARLRPGLAGLDRAKALAVAEQSARTDPSPTVRAAAFEPWAALGGPAVAAALEHYVTDPDPGIRGAAIVALACHGGPTGLQNARHAVDRLATSTHPTERALAARIGGLSCRGQLIHVPEQLLADPNLTVQRAAMTALGRAGDGVRPDVWRAVVAQLASPVVHRSAAAALVAAGERVLPVLAEAWSAWVDQPVLMARLAWVLARMDSPQADRLLMGGLDYPDELARTAIYRALRSKDGEWQEEKEAIRQAMRREAAHGAWLLAAQVDVQANGNRDGDGDGVSDLVACALKDRLVRTRCRLLDLLALMVGPNPVQRVELSLAQPSPEWRGNALEVLDVLLGPDLKRQVLPLFGADRPTELLAQLAPMLPQPQLGKNARLRQLLARPDLPGESWTRTVANYALNPKILTSGASMLSTIERVIILKTVEIFAQVPDDILAEVAALLTEVPMQAGTRIFAKGDLGDSMYIVVAGSVGIHAEDQAIDRIIDRIVERIIDRIVERGIFGEMALLDAAPRMASATADSDGLLLRLDHAPFAELMADHAEVPAGIIRVLSQRLRDRVDDIRVLQARLATARQE